MPTVYILREEWYPVYEIADEKDHHLKVDLIQTQIDYIRDATTRFDKAQDIIYQAIEDQAVDD